MHGVELAAHLNKQWDFIKMLLLSLEENGEPYYSKNYFEELLAVWSEFIVASAFAEVII